ncbi:MAG: RsmE family RNA methyltransferase [Candidatus Caldatribacteriaceae bacterium]
MGRFFFHPLLKEKETIALLPEEAHHLQVERVGLHSQIFLGDGQGRLFQGWYLGKHQGKVWVEVGEKVREEKKSPFELHIWQAFLHSPSRLDWLVEKLTEVGVSTIGFFPTERSLTTCVSPQRIRRWQKIALSACKQSGRLFFPEIRMLRSWNDFLSVLKELPGVILLADPVAPESLGAFLHQRGTEPFFSLLVGPEGDFTEEEKKAILSLPRVCRVRLFSKILRSETASFFGASILSSFLDGVYASGH